MVLSRGLALNIECTGYGLHYQLCVLARLSGLI